MFAEALICNEFGDLDKLRFGEIELPQHNDNEILIKVAASGINFPDLLIIENKYQFKPQLPFAPGGEISGVVQKIGKNVTDFKPGQRVFSLCSWGGFSNYIVVDQSRVFHLNNGIDFVTGASLMYNYSTALFALNQKGRLLQGETLLVMGAGGGVGMAAQEIGKIMGAKVIAAASKEKLEICGTKNPDFLVDYNELNFKEKLKETSANGGIDVVFDPVGGDWAETALRVLNRNGRYLTVGFASGKIPSLAFNLPLLKSSSIIGVFWGDFSKKEPLQNQQNLNWITRNFLQGNLKPFLGKIYSKKETVTALQDLKNRKIKGKAVVIWDEDLCLPQKNIFTNDNPKKRVFENFEEIKNHVGKDLGESDWFPVSQQLINEFGFVTHDTQWIHLDSIKAALSPMGNTIAHGWLTVSLSPYFLSQIFEIKNSKMGINYGTDKIRFIKPINTGTKVKMSAKLLEASEAPNNGLKLKVEAKYYTSDSINAVCVAEYLSIVY